MDSQQGKAATHCDRYDIAMPYAVVAVETRVAWPTSETSIQFDGRTLTLRPGTAKLYPTVHTKYEPDTREASAAAHSMLRRFLSGLAWSGEEAVRDVFAAGGGFPIQLGRSEELPKERDPSTMSYRWEPPADYLPEPTGRKARLALALYREALGLEHNNVPYAFLGFAKILNLGGSGKKQVEWINAAIGKLKDHFAKGRITAIQASETDVGEYLYGSGRCAVAHAANDPVVDPDDASDTLRLGSDLPVVKALAAHFVESELGIKTRSTIYSEHLYELAGFKELLGGEFVTHIRDVGSGEGVTAPKIAAISVRVDLRGSEDEAEFANLQPFNLTVKKGLAVLYCASLDRRLQLALVLDFEQERLGFDPERDVRIDDDGSVEAVDHAILRLRFLRGMISNGRTEVRDAATGRRIGRTDPCIPMNIDPQKTVDNIETQIAKLETERATRASAPTITTEPPSNATTP